MAQAILEEAENLKKRADILFATNKHELAIETYTQALRRLAFIAGYAVGELCVTRCFSNQAQCYVKLGQYDRALASINMAFTVPSIAHDAHMLSKLWVRKAIALENLHHDEEALASIDRAIAIGVGQQDEYDTIRSRLIEKVLIKTNRLIPIPPKPAPLPQSVVNATITQILLSYQDIDKLGPLLQSLIQQRAWMDCEDERKNNIMWALCQTSIMRAQTDSLDADAVSPYLNMAIVEGGALAEQRFHNHRNYTPLQMFAMAGALQCVNTILKYGGSTRTLDDDGWSALIVACAPNGPCSGKNSKVVNLLVKAKANVNQHTKTGLSALAAAAQSNDFESVRILLNAGASVNHRCDLGFSPIIWAKLGSEGKPNESVSVLLDYINSTLCNDVIRYEAQQDLKCFDLGKLLNALSRLKLSHVVDDNSLNILLSKAIIQLLKIDHSTNVSSSNMSVTFHEQVMNVILSSLVPEILTKRWVPRLPNHEDVDLALSTASSLERQWKKILESSLRSLPREEELDVSHPSLFTREGLEFYVAIEYLEFQQLVIDPISEQFGHVIVTSEVFDVILSSSKPVVMLIPHRAETLQLRTLNLLKSQGCNISTVKIGLWEEDTIDVALAHLPWLSNEEKSSLLPLVVIDVESWLQECSLLDNTTENRLKMFQATVDIIVEQLVDTDCELMVIGMNCEEGCEELLEGINLLIHELSTIFIEKLSTSKGCSLQKTYHLPSWPFEECVMMHFALTKSAAEVT